MRLTGTLLLCSALLMTFLQASHSHLHLNSGTDHAEHHHLGQAQTIHTHVPVPSGWFEQFEGLRLESSHEQDSTAFLPWTASASHEYSLLMALPAESTVLGLREQVQYIHPGSIHRSHDPPLVFSSAPRSPPV
jgi:hypothetical protein